MPRHYKLFRYHQVRRADELRLYKWLAVSVLVHALAMTWVASAARPAPPSAAASVPTAAILQAVLATPQRYVEAPPSEPEPVAQIPLAQPAPHPSIEQDKGEVLERHAPKTKQEATIEGATGLPVGNVTIGVVAQPGALNAELRRYLHETFPEAVSREPKLRGGLVVAYPQAALQTRMNKRVLVLVSIDAAGRLADARFQPDDPWFNAVLNDALKAARFVPAEQDGKRVPYWMILEFLFSVTGGAEVAGGAAPNERAVDAARSR